MIKFKTLVDRIETQLNNINQISGVRYKVHTDTGEFKKAIRPKVNEREEIINGIATVVSSENIPTQTGLNVSTLSVKIEFVYACRPTDDDRIIRGDGSINDGTIANVDGNVKKTSEVRSVLDEFCAGQSAAILTEDGVSYSVTELYSLTNTGVRGIRPIVGDSMTFNVFGTIYIVQQGESSTSDIFVLDGEIIPYIRHTVNRKTISQTDVRSGDSVARATAQGSSVQFNFVTPSVLRPVNNAIKKYILDGESNVAHILEYKAGKWANGNEASRLYLVLFDNASRVGEGTQNVSHEFMLVEAWQDSDFLAFPDGYSQLVVTSFSTQATIQCDKPAYCAVCKSNGIDLYKVDTPVTVGENTVYQTASAITFSQGERIVCTATFSLN